MARVVEILVAANAICGVIVFLTARSIGRKLKRAVVGDTPPKVDPSSTTEVTR